MRTPTPWAPLSQCARVTAELDLQRHIAPPSINRSRCCPSHRTARDRQLGKRSNRAWVMTTSSTKIAANSAKASTIMRAFIPRSCSLVGYFCLQGKIMPQALSPAWGESLNCRSSRNRREGNDRTQSRAFRIPTVFGTRGRRHKILNRNSASYRDERTA